MTSTSAQPISVQPSQSTAFLALDFTSYIVENYSSTPEVAARAAHALSLARSAGLPVFHVVPEAMRAEIHPLLIPNEDEPVLGKSTIGAFATTDLHARLQEQGCEQIIVAGVATSGTVLSTARWAFDIGYRVIVCVDACADPDPGAHAALVDERMFSESWLGLWRIATVLPTREIAALGM